MNCEWTAKLDRYVDGELTGDELAEFQGHLVGCAVCAAGALGRLQTKRMTRVASEHRYRPSAEFRLKVEQSVSEPKGGRWARQWGPMLALAATLLLTVASALWWVRSSRVEQGVSELADLHVATLASANPVDVASTDRHTVKPWFQGKVPFMFNLPELQNTPFRLLGGKVAYFHQKAGAQLLYAVGKHQISVFIFQEDAAARVNLGSTATFSSEGWTQGGLWYFALGDCSAVDLRALSDLLKSAGRP